MTTERENSFIKSEYHNCVLSILEKVCLKLNYIFVLKSDQILEKYALKLPDILYPTGSE